MNTRDLKWALGVVLTLFCSIALVVVALTAAGSVMLVISEQFPYCPTQADNDKATTHQSERWVKETSRGQCLADARSDQERQEHALVAYGVEALLCAGGIGAGGNLRRRNRIRTQVAPPVQRVAAADDTTPSDRIPSLGGAPAGIGSAARSARKHCAAWRDELAAMDPSNDAATRGINAVLESEDAFGRLPRADPKSATVRAAAGQLLDQYQALETILTRECDTASQGDVDRIASNCAYLRDSGPRVSELDLDEDS